LWVNLLLSYFKAKPALIIDWFGMINAEWFKRAGSLFVLGDIESSLISETLRFSFEMKGGE
jgi:hypothetical protein